MNKQQHSTGRQAGFTVIELVVVAVLVGLASLLTFQQLHALKVANDNSDRKTAINAMYYALEEVYYREHKSYPATLTSATLPSVDPKLFTDPDGFTLGKAALTEKDLQDIQNGATPSDDIMSQIDNLLGGKSANYHYDGINCDNDGNCKGYKLRADLRGEAEYVKQNRTHKN